MHNEYIAVTPPDRNDALPKFKAGDKVMLPRDNMIVPREFSGRTGTVTEVHADMQVQGAPGSPLSPTYMVQLDGEDDAMLVGEDWLELE